MPIDIPEIVERIDEEKCVFLLGPGLAKSKNGETLQSRLTTYFKEKNLGVEEDLDDLYTCDRKTKTRALDHLQKYCKEHCEPNESHQKLALIPFHLYISTTPDLLMKKAMDQNGVDVQFEYYIKDEPPCEVKKPNREKPLLYNLFGCIENQSSIIFNQWDLIQYLFSIIKDFKLPQNLRYAMKNANYFIFIGFDFEKWYLKLLLKLILEEPNFSIATQETRQFNEKLKSFYQRRYGMEFVDTDIENYISTLFDECLRQGVLREKRETSPQSVKDEIQKLIGKNNIEAAIEQLIEFMDGGDENSQEFINELYIHKGTFSKNEKDFRKGLITEEVANAKRVNICDALLKITDFC